MLLHGYYEYDDELGFFKKAFDAVARPFEKISKKIVPREIRKAVPRELRGIRGVALGTGVGLLATGAGGAALSSAASKVGSGAAKVGSALATGAKAAAPVIGAAATQVMQHAPQAVEMYGNMQQQKMQGQIHELEMMAHLENMRRQQVAEQEQMRLQSLAAQHSTPQPLVISSPGGGAGQRTGGIDPNMLMIGGAVALVGIVLITQRDNK
jgi:hypothetical protein